MNKKVVVGIKAYEVEESKADQFSKAMTQAIEAVESFYLRAMFPGWDASMSEAKMEAEAKVCSEFGASAIC